MADLPNVATRPISRDKLATFLGSQELIRAFENLAQDVGTTLPVATQGAQASADQAQVSADAAQDTADTAQINAATAQATADEALQATNDIEVDPGLGALWAEMTKLRNRIAALEQGTTA